MKTSVRIDGLRVEIRTRQLQNMKQSASPSVAPFDTYSQTISMFPSLTLTDKDSQYVRPIVL